MTEWKLVPVEPTEEMVSASLAFVPQKWLPAGSSCAKRLTYSKRKHIGRYTAMLAAAPKASDDEALEVKIANIIWRVLNEYESDPTSTRNAARAVLKMMEGE